MSCSAWTVTGAATVSFLLASCFPPAIQDQDEFESREAETEAEVDTLGETVDMADNETDENTAPECLTDSSCGHLDGTCLTGRCRAGVCVAEPTPDLPCDDQDPCTTNDTCGVDGCLGEAKSCDDGLECTDDSCTVTGDCTHLVMRGNCLIGGECFVAGATSEADECDVCVEGEAWTRLAPLECHPVCGDGLVTGSESCDPGKSTLEGCSEQCQVVDGYECEGQPSLCRTRCGDSLIVGREACDDGGNVGGDGCSPDCRVEPGFGCDISGCRPVCGDGWRMGGEGCDDGNLAAGDGCSPFCRVEAGWECSEIAWGADAISLPVRVYDFRAAAEEGGHPDFQAYLGQTPQTGLVGELLDSDDRPTFASRGVPFALTGPDEFGQWYRYVPGLNMYFDLALEFGPVTPNRDSYIFSAPTFFPIDGLGFGNYAHYDRNFHFTTHTQLRFEYRGGEEVRFSGDDDVWIFVNRKLAVDLGGTHGPANGAVTLSDSVDPLTGYRRDAHFDLHEGVVYEIHVFHAERYLVGSSYRLDLRLKKLRGNQSTCLR